jgi:hypothetical protein
MYRPISLLNTAYKILARILQTRLATALDHKLRPTQFGFRKNRSCSQPLHIVRRLQDKAERAGSSLYLLFLDWEKAFDRIHPEALLTALRRYGVSEGFVELIANIYQEPRFTVTAAGHTSKPETAHTGIRQGCPLSPYLFLVVHSAIMHDVETQLQQQMGTLPWVHSANHPLFDLAYADDTVLMGQSPGVVNKALHLIQTTAEHYNLKLNRGKCEYIVMNGKGTLTFTDGTEVKQVKAAKYLGAIITDTARVQADLRARLARARTGMDRLSKFWAHTDISIKWKLRIYQAVFIPTVLYGMESAHFTTADLQQLDSFHFQAMRKIYKIKATYYTEVINPQAHTTKNIDIQRRSNIPPLSQTLFSLQFKYLGHLLRGTQDQLEHNVCFTEGLASRASSASQRRGKPRAHWLEATAERALLQHSLTPPAHPNPTPFFDPYTYRWLKHVAVHRDVWRQFIVMPPTSSVT